MTMMGAGQNTCVSMFLRQSLAKCLIILVLVGVWATTAGLSWKDTASQEAEQAVNLYEENKLDEALVKITSAQVGMPDSPELQYNMGNVLYKQGKFEDARAGYMVASQNAPAKLAQSATFNVGNASFKAGDLEAAVEAYVKALLQDPNDDEARFNLEVALRTKQDQQRQSDQSEDQEQQDQKEDQQQSDDGEQQDQQQTEDQEQQQEGRQDQQEQDTDQMQGEEEQAEKRQPQQLTKDQIEQILAALEQQEEQVEKNLQKKKVGSSSVDKDW